MDDPRHLDKAVVEASFPGFYKHFLELAAFSERFCECGQNDGPSALDEAIDWLRETLADGPVAAV